MKRRIWTILLITFLAGCAVTHNKISAGQEYPFENLLKVHPGMTRAEVVDLLGRPYATGVNFNGDEVLEYSYMVTRTTSVGGGFILGGFSGSKNLSGAKAVIIVDKHTGKVTTAQYEVAGPDNYDKLVSNKEQTK